jgi:hypothetical protein
MSDQKAKKDDGDEGVVEETIEEVARHVIDKPSQAEGEREEIVSPTSDADAPPPG